MSSIFLHEITGSVTFRERIELPRGSVASVKLVNRKAEVLAATAFEVFQVPMDFTLYVDRADAPDPSKLSVWAVIRSEAGVWGTPDFVSASELPVTIHLRKIDVEE
ncbi:MAG: YbaY family lipoprotein [Kineosporiaceae bacterium]|nr:YbaY family lipoprotein [Aeromicrobium sp.]